jgi:hypothetical protein
VLAVLGPIKAKALRVAAKTRPALTGPARGGCAIWRSGRKNARGAGRTKEWNLPIHNIQTDHQSSPRPTGVAMFGINSDRRPTRIRGPQRTAGRFADHLTRIDFVVLAIRGDPASPQEAILDADCWPITWQLESGSLTAPRPVTFVDPKFLYFVPGLHGGDQPSRLLAAPRPSLGGLRIPVFR